MAEGQYFIIGFGVFGASTAFHIGKANIAPPRGITVLAFHQAQAPSDDISKIIRIDYPSVKRMREAIYAQQQWKSEIPFSQYYLPVGRIVAYDEARLKTLDGIDGTRFQLGLEPRARLGKDVLEQIYGSTDAPSGLTFVHNEDDALVEWEGCMNAVRQSVQSGSQGHNDSLVVQAEVRTLLHGGNRIHTILLASGEEIDTKKANLVLSAGPWTANILKNSQIESPPGSRTPVATGVFSFLVRLSDEQLSFFKGRPAFSHIEFLPPTKDDGIAKITSISPFTYAKDGSTLSGPVDVSQSFLAIETMLKMCQWARTYLPRLKGARIIDIKSYWDGMTETQDPVLARHPDFSNLFVAGGGSYNRAKDLPILGENIVRVLCGEKIDTCYEWDPSNVADHQDQPGLLAKTSFQELEKRAAENVEVDEWISKRKSIERPSFLEEI